MKKILFFVLLMLLIQISIVYATDAMVAYRSNTGSCTSNALNCPKIRFWNSSGNGSYGSEIELATAGSPIRNLIVKHSPISNKIVIVTQSDDGNLDAFVCNSGCTSAGSWGTSNNIGNVWSSAPATHSRRFDVEFETSSGDAVLVYGVLSTNAAQDLAYKVLTHTSTNFSGLTENYINDAGVASDVQYTWVRLSRNTSSSSQDLIVVGFDSTGSDISGWVWNGTDWRNQQEISTAATSAGGLEAIGTAYAYDNSKAFIVGPTGGAGVVNGAYWTGSWTTSNPGDITTEGNDDVVWLNIKSDPTTDDLRIITVSNTAVFNTIVWNGTAWGTANLRDAAIDASATRSADFDWNQTSSNSFITQDTDTTGTNISWNACSSTNSCNGGTSLTDVYEGTGAWITGYANPTSTDGAKVVFLRLNSNFDIGSFYWNGMTSLSIASIGLYGNSALTADATVTTFESYSMSFQKPTGTLSATLVTPTGVNSQTQNQTFDLTANVTCSGSSGAICGTVNGTVRYNASSSSPDTAIQGSGVSTTPFYATQSNPQTCGVMRVNDNACSLTWTINATGSINSSYKLDTNFTSDNQYVNSNSTSTTTINIIGAALSITISNVLTNVQFGSLNPGTTNNAAVNNTNDAYNITCSNTGANCNISIKGNDNLYASANVIGIGNVSWNQTNTVSGEKALTLSYEIINVSLPDAQTQKIYFWLDVPNNQVAGSYLGNFTILGQAN